MAISYASGQVLTAAGLNLLAPLFAQKASNQNATVNSTTKVNDNDIVFTVVPNQTVMIDAWLSFQQSVATGANVALDWISSGTVTGVIRMVQGPADTGTGAPDSLSMQSRAFTTTANNLYICNTLASSYVAHEVLIYTTGNSGGTIQMRFGDFTATATSQITMLAGTFAVCRYVA